MIFPVSRILGLGVGGALWDAVRNEVHVGFPAVSYEVSHAADGHEWQVPDVGRLPEEASSTQNDLKFIYVTGQMRMTK